MWCFALVDLVRLFIGDWNPNFGLEFISSVDGGCFAGFVYGFVVFDRCSEVITLGALACCVFYSWYTFCLLSLLMGFCLEV